MAIKALEMLTSADAPGRDQDSAGMFLMIEGSRIEYVSFLAVFL